jgi:hypothetical protein
MLDRDFRQQDLAFDGRPKPGGEASARGARAGAISIAVVDDPDSN